MASGKGILAADESIETMNKRLREAGVEQDEEMRRQYRDLLLNTPGAEQYLSGVILYDETLRQESNDGVPFGRLLERKGILPGIKVDRGKIPLPFFEGEEITEGLDNLGVRLKEYYEMGARFAKWRAVITISEDTPTTEAIGANAHAMARYAALCQENHIVPMVEPEVLYDGAHTIERCREVMEHTMRITFDELMQYRVLMPGLILKTSMALPGKDSGREVAPAEVARHTVEALMEAVPRDIGGVVFLSGGQTPVDATEHLNAIARLGPLPWPVTFSYARALQEPVLTAWHGQEKNRTRAQEIFMHRLSLNAAAQQGKYTSEME